MIWMYWRKFSLMEEHSAYKILYYQNQVKMSKTQIYSEEERVMASQAASKLQAKMFHIETRFKDILALNPKY